MNKTPTTRIDRMEKKKAADDDNSNSSTPSEVPLAGWLKYLQPIERDRDRPSSMLDSFIAYQSCHGDCAFTTIYSTSAELFEKILQEEIGGKTWADTKNNNINGGKKTHCTYTKCMRINAFIALAIAFTRPQCVQMSVSLSKCVHKK